MSEEHGPTIRQLLRAEGKRVTSQRALLLRIIKGSSGHLDAYDIYHQAKEHDPRISLSTVYRTLNLLKELDVVVEFHFDEEHHHYEMTADTVHHHLVCTECGRIVEFQSPLVGGLKAELEQEYGFSLERLQIDALGRCKKCQGIYTKDR